MKILIVTQYFWPEDFRINDCIAYFTDQGHEVTILTGLPNYPEGHLFKDYKAQPDRFNKFNGANILRVPIILRGNNKFKLVLNYISFIFSASIIGLFKLRKKTYDVIFVYEPSPITVGIPAIIISKFKKSPVVFWTLDLWPETLVALDVIRSRFLIAFFQSIARYIYKNCALVLGQSKSFVTTIKKYVPDQGKVIFFPSWSEDIQLDTNERPATEITAQKDKFNILFAGNIAEAQDIPNLLRAIKLLKDHNSIRWIFVGDGRKLNWLKEQVNINKLQQSVLVLGRFPFSRMNSFFKHADALLVSLRSSEAFSMTIPAKIQTYLKTGIPILGMLDGDGREVIDSAGAGFTCSAGDYEGLSRIALKLSSLEETSRKDMGAAGIKYASNNFDRIKLFRKLEDIFKNVSV